MDLLYVIPPVRSGEEVERSLNGEFVCPYCRLETTRSRNDIGWVESPLRTGAVKWICRGCCIEIYNASLAENFPQHLYFDFAKEVARLEGKGVNEIRRLALEHQKSLIENRPPDRFSSGLQDLKLRIEELLNSGKT